MAKVRINISIEQVVLDRIKKSGWENTSEYISDLVNRDALIKNTLRLIDERLQDVLKAVKSSG